MQRTDHIRPTNIKSEKSKLINESTQSDEKSTRNVGTMHEPVQTKNFGNELQPQSSSTQTSLSLKQKPAKPFLTFIERSEHTPTPINQSYSDQRIFPRPQEDISYSRYDPTPDDRFKSRSPLPPPPSQTSIYPYDRHHPCYDTQHEELSYYHLPPSSEDYRYSPRLPSYRPTTTIMEDRPHTPIYRSRTPSPQRRSYTPTPRSPSPYRRSHSTTPRRRPQMCSQETDTSLDGMKQRQHAGVQFEPRTTREQGTTPSLRTKNPTTNHRPIPLNTSIYSQRQYPTSSSRHQDLSQRNYPFTTTTTTNNSYYQKEEEEEEEYAPSMHDKSTMAELTVSFDHYTQCESQPYMADRYMQTTPTLDEYEQRNMFNYPEESDIQQLPRRNSTFIPQPTVIQPDTLPRTHRSHHSPTRPKRDGLDYTGNILEVSLQHGQQQRTTPIRNSPLLNIGTENFILQSPANEYTIPFETHYVPDSYSYSTSRSRNNDSVTIPVIESPRTHLFTDSPVRQSKSNGNFYLSTAPSRSLNSSLRINIRTD